MCQATCRIGNFLEHAHRTGVQHKGASHSEQDQSLICAHFQIAGRETLLMAPNRCPRHCRHLDFCVHPFLYLVILGRDVQAPGPVNQPDLVNLSHRALELTTLASGADLECWYAAHPDHRYTPGCCAHAWQALLAYKPCELVSAYMATAYDL